MEASGNGRGRKGWERWVGKWSEGERRPREGRRVEEASERERDGRVEESRKRSREKKEKQKEKRETDGELDSFLSLAPSLPPLLSPEI